MAKSTGVYILANDRVYDLVVAFVHSFRRTNGRIPLCLIPFDDSDYKVRAFCREHWIDVFDDRDLLLELDQHSQKLHGRIVGQYRKVAAWGGPFDEFIFVDIDTIALMSFDFVFSYLGDYDFVASHANLEWIRKWTWLDSAYSGSGLTREQIDYSANTGFFASKRTSFDLADLPRAIAAAVPIARHMQLGCYEQPFLNYWVVTSGKRYTSLSGLGVATGRELPCECWPGDSAWRLNAKDEFFYNGEKKAVMLIHWAGCWWPTKLERRMERLLRRFGFKIADASVRRWMRFGRIWRHYRYLEERPLENS